MLDPILDLAQYLGISIDETHKRTEIAPIINARDWDKADPKTHDDISGFYKSSEYYVAELARYEETRRRAFEEYLNVL
ncbi:unnamed protein product, partial [marine sediment metagenome]